MTLTLAKADLSARDGADALTVESLRGDLPGHPEPEWLATARRARLVEFLESDRSFGRYSRLKLDWASLPPEAARFEVLENAHPGAEGLSARFAPLSEAIAAPTGEEWRKLVRPQCPWDKLVLAGWREGMTVTWPSGSKGDSVPELVMPSPGGLVLDPILLDVAAQQEAGLALRWTGGHLPAFHATSIYGRVADGSTLRLFLLHEGEGIHHHLSGHIELGRDASVEIFCAWMGGPWSVVRLSGDLDNQGAQWRESHVILTSGKEHLDLDSQIRQRSHHTHCDVQVKTVATGNSRAVFTGNILMDLEAKQSEAYLSDHVLLLSRGARADSIPGLEIKAADVKASHAATVGQVDEEQMFYLQSRGLSEEAAKRLIVVGFLESLMDRAPFSFVPEALDAILEGRIAS